MVGVVLIHQMWYRVRSLLNALPMVEMSKGKGVTTVAFRQIGIELDLNRLRTLTVLSRCMFVRLIYEPGCSEDTEVGRNEVATSLPRIPVGQIPQSDAIHVSRRQMGFR